MPVIRSVRDSTYESVKGDPDGIWGHHQAFDSAILISPDTHHADSLEN